MSDIYNITAEHPDDCDCAHCYDPVRRVADLQAQRDTLARALLESQAQMTEVMHDICRLQPNGSPPPGGLANHAAWCVQSAQAALAAAEEGRLAALDIAKGAYEERDALRADLARVTDQLAQTTYREQTYIAITEDQTKALARVTADRDDLQATFDLRHAAERRAVDQWHAAGNDPLTWPDHADLVVWLAEQAETLRRERDEARASLSVSIQTTSDLSRTHLETAASLATARESVRELVDGLREALTIEDLDALDALYAKATGGRWKPGIVEGEDGDTFSAAGPEHALTDDEDDGERDGLVDAALADAESIAALHNAWPSVSAMLRRALTPPPAAVPGLVFVPGAEGDRAAKAVDGGHYEVCTSEMRPGQWFWTGPKRIGLAYVATEAEAIAAANAHNAARLAKKGGE